MYPTVLGNSKTVIEANIRNKKQDEMYY